MKKLIALVLGLLFVGCVNTSSVKLGTPTTRAALDYRDVAIYSTASQVPGKYEEVAILNSRGDSMWTNEEGMAKSMQRKAAKLGANAIILDAVSEPSAGAKVAAAFLLGRGADRKGKAMAIYVYPGSKK